MPVAHHGGLYNCHVILFNRKVIGIRPKIKMADGDNYFESKWFTNWDKRFLISDFKLPLNIQKITS